MWCPMDGLPDGLYFCSHPRCPNGLHVRAGDPGVKGDGAWAKIPGGAIIGRCIVDNVYLCDGCARALIAGLAKIIIVPPPKPQSNTKPVQHALAFTDA